MAKVPGTTSAQNRHRPKLERRWAKRGIKQALNALDVEAVQRERDGHPMTEQEFRARAVQIVQRGEALLDYRLGKAAGLDVTIDES